MALVESLLTAMIRADGDALVMHVGERPYVVVGTGTLDLSSQILNLGAMTGMLQQLLPAAAQDSLEEFGAVEHRLPPHDHDAFTVVAARGGDDIWIEIRRRRNAAPVAAAPAPVPAPAVNVDVPPALVEERPAIAAAVPIIEVPPLIIDSPPVVIDAPPAIMETPAAMVEEPAAIIEEAPIIDEAPITEVAPVVMEVPPAIVEAPPGMVEEPLPVVTEPAAVVAELPMVAETPVPVEELPVEIAMTSEVDDALLQELAAAEAQQAVAEALVIAEELRVIDELARAVAEEQMVVAEEPLVVAAEEPLVVAEEPLPVAEEPLVIEAEAPLAIEEDPSVALLEEQLWPHSAVVLPEPVAEAPMEAPVVLDAPVAMEAPLTIEAPVAMETPIVPVAPAALDLPEAPAASELAPILQMTRTVRIEVPPRSVTVRGSGVERLLRLAAARAASTLFVTSDCRPSIRVEGDIRPLDGEPPMTRADVESAVMEIVPEAEQEAVGRGDSTEWITEFADLGRVRCITFTDHRGPGVVFRMIATRAATAEQLGLSREVQALATEPQGLVLVAGLPGNGKSTLVSALVDLVNRQRAEYVVTLERQIRLVHDNRTAIVSQREIRGGVDEALSAARAALREDPDVLVVDDLASAHMVPLLLEAASEGLVFVSITAPSTIDAVERFVDLAPADERAGVQAAMAETFRGAVAQVLLKKVGGGRVAAREVLLATAAVTRVISDGTAGQLQAALEGGRKHGMVPLADALVALVHAGVVDVREAFRKSPDRDRLLVGLKREGVDTSVVERLA